MDNIIERHDPNWKTNLDDAVRKLVLNAGVSEMPETLPIGCKYDADSLTAFLCNASWSQFPNIDTAREEALQLLGQAEQKLGIRFTLPVLPEACSKNDIFDLMNTAQIQFDRFMNTENKDVGPVPAKGTNVVRLIFGQKTAKCE